MILSQLFVVFGAGVLASLSPCVYPMLPITIGFLGSQDKTSGNKTKVALYVLGQTVTLVLLGVVAVLLGESLGFSSQSPYFNFGIGFFLLLAGWVTLRGKLPAFMEKWNQGQGSVSTSRWGGGVTAFLLGASASLMASPCTSPMLGSVLALMAGEATFYQGILMMLIYSMGFSLLFLVLGLGVVKFNRFPRAGNWMTYLHKGAGFLLLVVGVFYIYRGYADFYTSAV